MLSKPSWPFPWGREPSCGGQGTHLCSLQLASSNVIYFDLFAVPARLSLLFILKRTRQIISVVWGWRLLDYPHYKTYVCIYHDWAQWATAPCVCHNHFYEFNFQCPSFCVVWFICVLCSTNGRAERRQQCPLLISSWERKREIGRGGGENYLNMSLSVDGLANKLNYLFTLCECWKFSITVLTILFVTREDC